MNTGEVLASKYQVVGKLGFGTRYINSMASS